MDITNELKELTNLQEEWLNDYFQTVEEFLDRLPENKLHSFIEKYQWLSFTANKLSDESLITGDHDINLLANIIRVGVCISVKKLYDWKVKQTSN